MIEMQLRDKSKTFVSLVAIGLFLVSTAYAGNTSVTSPPLTGQPSLAHTEVTQSLPAQTSNLSGTWASWQQESNTTSDQWTWQSKNWLFGPSPSFEIYHQNGTLLTSSSYAEINEVLHVVVSVPKDILQGADIGSVRFDGWYQTADWNFSANFGFSYENYMYTYEPWNAYSSQYNYTDTEGGPPLPTFLDIHSDGCTNTSDTSNYYFTFAISFNSYTPLGLYQLNMGIQDDNYNSIGSFNYGSSYEFQGIAVGIDPALAWSYSYGGSYTLQKLDMSGDTVYSVSRMTDFMMQFNISGDLPEWVQMSFTMPRSMQVPVNRTGYHSELQTSYGGWVYDSSLQTYVWNSSVQVTTSVQVYGQYQDFEYTDLGGYEEVNFTVLNEQWNDTTMTYDYSLVNQSQWVQKMMFFVYNTSTGSFNTYLGYTYYGYPYDTIQPDTWNEQITVYEPIPADYPIMYELTPGASEAQTIGNELVVDFVGHFTDLMPKTSQGSCFYFDTQVKGTDYYYSPDTYGDHPRETPQEFDLARSITIESPVTIAKVLKADGSQPYGWMFQVNQGEQFMVRGRLQGGSAIADGIDGISFSMQTYDSFWSESETRWSSLQYVVEIETSGAMSLSAYNQTQKYNYTYGTYMDYVLENKTGWFYSYNASTNTWQWTYGEYQDWEWAEVSGYHWQYWYFNQLTREWQTDYIQWGSEETVVPADFGVVSDFTKWTSGGDLFAQFLFTPNDKMPQADYQWNFAFMNNTWHEDYSSGWGEHQIMSWDNEWVYSFDYTGKQVYVDSIQSNQLAYNFLNGTLAGQTALGVESPYIVISGQKYPIQTRDNYDPASGSSWKTMYFYDHYDPETGRDVYYYLLANGTKVWVDYTDTIQIYNVTTTTHDSFLTAQQYPYYFYDGATQWAYWIDIDGAVHYGTSAVYEKYNLAYFGLYDHVDLTPNQPLDAFILYGSGLNMLNLVDFWWSSRDNCYYMTTTGGALISMKYNSGTGNYQIFFGGVWQSCTWPIYYYEEDYIGSPAMLVASSTSRFYYTEISGVKNEMPYPGANANWNWELDNTVTDGGKVPTTKSLIWNALKYPVLNISFNDYVKISGQLVEVQEIIAPYLRANGTDVWYPTQNGYSGNVGTYDADLMFTGVEQISYNNVTNDPSPWWISGNQYLLYLNNGTTWQVNGSYIFTVYEYDYQGRSFYSTQEWPAYNELGNDSWYSYKSVNGTMYRFEEWVQPQVLSEMLVRTYYNASGYFFSFMGKAYQFNYEGRYQYVYWMTNATYSGGDLYLFWENGYSSVRPIYDFNYKGQDVEAVAHQQYVKRLRDTWGYALVYGLTPIDSTVYRNFNDFIIGTPQWGMWGIKNWVVNPDNGAVDLDGNLATTSDQYYVEEVYDSIQSWTYNYTKMWVNILWDPNTTLYGDEMNVWSWMGLETYSWSYQWNETFYWYHADDFSQLTTAEMQDVYNQLVSPEGDPMPGYWDIASMAKNVTWEDILAEALANGWDWMTSNEQTWTWLSFGISQNYGTSYQAADVEHWLNIGMHYEFSGLMIWEDENNDSLMQVDLNNPGSAELSHYLIPDSVSSVDFVTPGAAYGNLNDSGSIVRGIEDEITWGVTFNDVNGTVYPYTTTGYWGWYDGIVTGTDLRTFDERPTTISIDELSFLVHFQGHLNTTGGALNNYAQVKVDNYIGNWDVGMTSGRDNLENKSLALNYLADVSVSDFAFKAGGSFADQESTVGADVFQFETAGAQFAQMIMGGMTYDWGKNTTAPYDVVSMTTPVGTFRQAFESESGQSAVGWSSTSSMFYVTIGFTHWDGYSVYQDPVFVGYTSAHGTAAPIGDVRFGTLSISPSVPTSSDSVTVSVQVFSQAPVEEIYLDYSTDMNTFTEVSMWNSDGNTYSGQIPPFPDGTVVYFRVAVKTAMGWTESQIATYVVGQGLVTTGTTGSTMPPVGSGAGPPVEVIIMVGGIAGVLALVLILVKRRK